MSRRRSALADALGLVFILLALADYLRPTFLLTPTIMAGGDTPCHYPTFVFFHEHLLPRLRFHGWYPGAYLGHPVLLYYFPFPFLVMSALAPFTGMPVAFKLGTALGVFLLPLLTYASFRLMGFRFPGPLLGAAAALVFLLLEENPIWGGTLASTLTGEFAYTYGIGFATLFLGVVYRAFSRGARPWLPGAMLALTALAHGYAVLWAGLSASYFLYSARRPTRALLWLMGVAATAFGLAAFWLLPLLSDWGWTTSYDDPWITVATHNLVPRLLLPLFACALLGLVGTLLMARRTGGPDHRLLFLLHAAVVGAALAAAGPALGIIDVRFVPFAQFAACLAGAAAVGLVLEGLAAPDLAALGLVVAFSLWGDAHSQVLRGWTDWNYSGLEARELWPAFRGLSERLKGTVSDPRVAVEYSQEHEKAGSIRMYETLPYFTGRSTLEGVYNQASLMTHPVYYLASELNALSPNPFRNREYSSFDTENALRHLRLFNTREIVALSPKLTTALEPRDDVEFVTRVPPYTVYRLKDHGPGYVEPLGFAPMRSPRKGWRDRAYRWFTWKPQSPVHLVFSDEARLGPAWDDPWLPPPAKPLDPGVSVTEAVDFESVSIRTSRPGHPLLVKIGYHPRWKAEGADGPYLVSPGLMMVVPRQPEVRLAYSRDASDAVGLVLTIAALAAGLGAARRRAAAGPVEPVPVPDACDSPPSPRRWGALVPGTLLVLLAAGRFAGGLPDHERDVADLYERASKAYGAERWEEAAEFARHALAWSGAPELTAELRCLRGESLLRGGRPREAAEEFEKVAEDKSRGAHLPEALFGLVEARTAAGDPAAANAARERLLEEYPETPWADRARTDRQGRSERPGSP
jgi:TolA-binding protein